MNTSKTTETRWRYRLNKEIDGKHETREVVETRSGSLDRLIAIGGRPLNTAEQNDEAERILRLSHDPEQQRKLEESGRQGCGAMQPVSSDDPRRFSLLSTAHRVI